ncbi:hypothetical protein Cni_G05066 [Canna indica]|uniref:Uncharacterized protein n=1 Tax=Canna indica TaxID=4628 RepID=A0AAQ3JWD3_9LILI|nr:hypothetical protein Cni_G05066 [Canna indica]
MLRKEDLQMKLVLMEMMGTPCVRRRNVNCNKFCFMKMLAWNIWGADKREAKEYLWSLVKIHKIDIIFLAGTHMLEDENKLFLRKMRRNWDGEFVNSMGRGGGMMMFWKKENVNLIIVHKDDQSINALVNMKKGKHCLVSEIYASTDERRRALWKRLSQLEIPDIPWIVGGYELYM